MEKFWFTVTYSRSQEQICVEAKTLQAAWKTVFDKLSKTKRRLLYVEYEWFHKALFNSVVRTMTKDRTL